LRVVVAGAEETIEFVRHLANAVVTELPGTATFECELSRPNVKVQWSKAGKPLLPDHKFDVVMEATVHRLVVRDVTGLEDVAEYAATVRGLASRASLDIQGETTIIDDGGALTRCGHVRRQHGPYRGKERKGKEEYLYSAFSHQGTYKALMDHTCKQHHACLSFVAFTRCHHHSN